MAKYSLKSLLSWVPKFSFSTTDRGLRRVMDEDGFVPLNSFFQLSPQFNDYTRDTDKLFAVLNNPAVLKVFTLQCDLFSLGKIKLEDDGKEMEADPLLSRMSAPNYFQSKSQFLWDFMFWTMLGTSYCYVDSKLADNDDNKIYLLDISKLEFPQELIKMKDKLVLSSKTREEILKYSVKYKYEDGSSVLLPLHKIIITTDLSNGTGNWFKGHSRIDALYKIISNVDEALNAYNINTRYSGKFLVAGTQDPQDTSKLPMTNEEKKDLETKVNGRKKVLAFKSMIEIKRFVEDLRKLELGKQYLEHYYLIGSMYNIPRDVLEAYNSSTYENQEKARTSHVSYTLQPKGNDFMEAIAKYFSYDEQKKKLSICWDHLPFMQVFEKDKAVTKEVQIRTLASMLKMGIPLEEANLFLGTNFKSAQYEQSK